jgi:hypothetical protein
VSASIFKYRARTGVTTGDPSPGKIIWNSATQASATGVGIDILDDSGLDVSIGLASLEPGNKLYFQEYDNAANYQDWTITTVSGSPGYWTYGVTLNASGGTGSTNFVNGLMLGMRVTRPGATGPTGPAGPAGADGATGLVKVTHGANPSIARPTAPLVYWVGTVQPTNALADDLLLLKGT